MCDHFPKGKYLSVTGKRIYAIDRNHKLIPEIISSIDLSEAPAKWVGITPDGREVEFAELLVPLDNERISNVTFDKNRVAHFSPCT